MPDTYWAVMKDGECIAKVVWDGQTDYTFPWPHDELVEDPNNSIRVVLPYVPPQEPE